MKTKQSFFALLFLFGATSLFSAGVMAEFRLIGDQTIMKTNVTTEEHGLDVNSLTGQIASTYIISSRPWRIGLKTFNSSGNALSDGIVVNSQYSHDNATVLHPDVIWVDTDTIAVIWSNSISTGHEGEGLSSDVRLRLFDKDLNPVTDEIPISPSVIPTKFKVPRVVYDAYTDSVVVVWTEYITSNRSNLYMRAYTSGGIAKTDVVNLTAANTSEYFNIRRPYAAINSRGNLAIAVDYWGDILFYEATLNGIVVGEGRYNPTSATETSENVHYNKPMMVIDDDIFISYATNVVGQTSHFYTHLLRLDNDFNVTKESQIVHPLINSFNPSYPYVNFKTPDVVYNSVLNEIIVVMSGVNDSDNYDMGDNIGIYAQRFSREGDAIGEFTQINQDPVGRQTYPIARILPNGEYFIGFMDKASTGAQIAGQSFGFYNSDIPDLNVSTNATPDDGIIGDNVEVTYTVANTRTEFPASQVRLNDSFGDNLIGLPLSVISVNNPDWNCVWSEGLSCSMNSSLVSSSTFLVSIDTSQINKNTSLIASSQPSVSMTQDDYNANDNTAVADEFLLNSYGNAVLTAEFQNSEGIETDTYYKGAGKEISVAYLIDVEQTSRVDSVPTINNMITVDFSTGLQIDTMSTGNWTCYLDAMVVNRVNCTSDSLLPGNNNAITINTIVDAAFDTATSGVLSATTTLTNELDHTVQDHTQTDTIKVYIHPDMEPEPGYIISVALTDSIAAIDPGGKFNYVVTITNSSNFSVPSLQFSLPLPEGVVFSRISAHGWKCTTPAKNTGGVIACNRSSIGGGENLVIPITVVAKTAAPGELYALLDFSPSNPALSDYDEYTTITAPADSGDTGEEPAPEEPTPTKPNRGKKK